MVYVILAWDYFLITSVMLSYSIYTYARESRPAYVTVW